MEDQNKDLQIIEEITKDHTVKKYYKGKFLGKGGFAKCYEVVTVDTKKVYASKMIPKATLTKRKAKQKVLKNALQVFQLMSEIKIHRSISQQNIVVFEHFFEDSENVYILLELCPNQTMNELLRRRKRLTELEVQCYLLQMLSAIKYMHKNKIIHRDLKLGNLFLSEKMEIKIGDFGLATKVEFEGERKRTVCGTPNYIAPEILESKNGHSYEVDIWSLGVIIYTLLIGKPPFETNDVKSTYRRIRMNAYSFPEHIPISNGAKNLITRILQLDPSRRPTLDEIAAHEFVHPAGTIPKLLPVSTLACPPSQSYIRQFQNVDQQILIFVRQKDFHDQSNSPKKKDFDNTAPNLFQKQFSLKESKKEFEPRLAGLAVSGAESNNHQGCGTQFNSQTDLQKSKGQPQYKSVDRFKQQPPPPATIDNPLNQNYIIPLQDQDNWIKKWVDYSSKYGLGYLLSNGHCGVFFNDCTKILLSSDVDVFSYFDRGGEEECYRLSEFPNNLNKKVTLLHHFRNYLLETKSPTPLPIGDCDKFKAQNKIYVKKWLKSKHAIVFRFSDKTVQVVFTDGTQVMLTQQLRILTYQDKQGQKVTMLLQNALESENHEMVKRLKYTKEILSQMLMSQNQQIQLLEVAERNSQKATQPLQEHINKLNTIQQEGKEQQYNQQLKQLQGSCSSSNVKTQSQMNNSIRFINYMILRFYDKLIVEYIQQCLKID